MTFENELYLKQYMKDDMDSTARFSECLFFVDLGLKTPNWQRNGSTKSRPKSTQSRPRGPTKRNKGWVARAGPARPM